MRLSLENVTNKIEINDYSLKELADFFEKFDDAILIIETDISLLGALREEKITRV